MKKVILAEKPAQAMDYAKALGISKKHNGYIEIDSDIVGKAIVTWAIGHLVEMKAPDEYKEPVNAWELNNLPFFPTKYEYKVTKSKRSQFNIVKKLMNEADTIINATDYGREGSNIFYSIYRLSGAKNKVIKRYVNSSLVHEDIRRKFKELENNQTDLNMYKEANARQISDWLVGMNLTSLYTNIFKNKGINEVISIGRVQTPTLYMIYERQKAIENFVSEPFYEIKGQFKTDNGEYHGKAKIKTKDKSEITQIYEQYKLERASKGTIQKLETNEKKVKSPNLFSLNLLQQSASHLFKFDSKETTTIAQSLYDKKFLTYARTDTAAITQSEYNYLLNRLEDLKTAYKLDFETKHTEARKPYVVEAIKEHHAIIPTSKVPTQSDIDALNEKEKKILNLVVSTTLAMFANDYIYDETSVETNVNDLIFYSKGKVEKDKGWKVLFSRNNDDDDDNEKIGKLPYMKLNQEVESKLEQTEGKTQPPKPFTDGQLIAMMEKAGKSLDDDEKAIMKESNGLGTEATRADIIQTLIIREYIISKKNRYHVTPKGVMVCLAVENTLLSSPSMTAEWEKRLKQIGNGEANQNTFIQMIKKFIEKELSLKDEKQNNVQIENIAEKAQQKNNVGKCPNCSNGHIVKRGKVYKCTDCEQVFFSNFFKKKLSENQIKEIITNGKTKKKLKLPKKDGSTYEAFLCLENDDSRNMKKYGVSFK